ncbi:NAD(P)H-hydrate dehydratase [Parasphingopyxis lamellibrachiae]|uniref:Bifunctional NAD(P)H-hydrate repair enzyme n=1 Tax=Parasphingopyxis lamellibrachiae TaxID=680125 RepID=A0A3D9FCN7_9SPHN|nr:NAD(P)H-hydrate dehydratase [Parasphingopyxis lamellibrachiae]RED15428.1 hydroxyethylthiazole kinase-like uncharacterized protein yjeF/hydroxyethylthiazole kinase-like uncharacterized protein yjeF [Parasphingopyxis lamellibrachiae]
MTFRPILTAEEMVAAEGAAMADGVSVEELMERAGRAVADIAWRIAGKSEALILCGPGNNGGDGYVVARLLADRGCKVRVAALAEPRTDVAKAACERWGGPVEPVADAKSAPLLIDALFGTGLMRPLGDTLAKTLAEHVGKARYSIAVDLPSGIETDSGALLSAVPHFDVTVGLGALKPAHLLQPSARYLGRVILGEIGVEASSSLVELGRPGITAPTPGDHKYSRGFVLVAKGAMAGAACLCAGAAMRAGAGYVMLAGPDHGAGPLALVHRPASDPRALADLLADERVNVAAIGPGLGLNEEADARLDEILTSGRRLVLDADALTLMVRRGAECLNALETPPILTPHHGEFVRLFGGGAGNKVERARDAASRSGSVVVYKGSDTVIAAPDGRAAIAPPAPTWLASAGTGDVLTGIVAARYATSGDAFTAACEAVWLHGEAARRAGPFLIADDLVGALPGTLAACLQ